MPAPSLVEICTKICIKNVHSLTDVGAFEYFQIAPVLARITSPEQLHQIEYRSPQIKGEDAELWRKFIARDIPNWREKNYAPKNPMKWYEVYCKYRKEQAAEIRRDEEVLRQQMMGIQQARETNVSRVVELKQLPKVPRDPRMLANNGGVPIGKKVFKKEAPSSLVFSAGSKTRLTDGRSVLTRARREAKEISQMGRLSKPTHQLRGKMGQVHKAPEGMVKQYQTAAQPALRILSRTTSIAGKIQSGQRIGGPSLEEREQRLRALTMAGSKTDVSQGTVKETTVGSDSEDEAEDLFDEPAPRKTHPIKRQCSSPPLPPSRVTAKKAGVIHTMASKTRPVATVTTSSPPPKRPAASICSPPPSRPSLPVTHPISMLPRINSPATGVGIQKTMIPRKKEVDIFNRGTKRPRFK